MFAYLSRRVPHRGALVVAATLAAACGAESVKGAPPVSTSSTPAQPAPAVADSVARARAESVRVAARDSVRLASAPADSTHPAAAAIDSTRLAGAGRGAAAAPGAPGAPGAPRTAGARSVDPAIASAHLIAGRNAHDSISFISAIRAGRRNTGWPVDAGAPLPGAILPAKRIVAFYGNPLVKRMGVLGEYPSDEMLRRLDTEVARWREADPSTPVQPALHLIAVVAQGDGGSDGMYRARMRDTLIERVYAWAQSRHALLFLDIQVGRSTLQSELPRLLPFLARPDVHLGIDPEFSMHYDKEGLKPGRKIGTMMAADVNYAVRTLADLVAQKQLPPKILVVHRFTKRMVPNPREIRLDRRVQVVMDMDGWGPAWLKFDSYRDYIVADPVQFTGFKLFFHNDTKVGPLLTPAELLHLVPKPLYIQYQ